LNPNIFRFGHGKWTPDVRSTYNLVDGITRHTTQVGQFFFANSTFSNSLREIGRTIWSAKLSS